MKADSSLAVLFLAMLILQGTVHAQASPKATFIHGKILDDAGVPIEGAKVELIRQTDGAVIDSFITASDSLYIVRMNFQGDEGSADVLLRVTKSGYSTYQKEMQIQGGSPPVILVNDVVLAEDGEEAPPKSAPQETVTPLETTTPPEIPITAVTSPPIATVATEAPRVTPTPLEDVTVPLPSLTHPPDTPEPEIVSLPSSPEITSTPGPNVEEHSSQKAIPDKAHDSERKKGLLERIIDGIKEFFRRIF